MYNLNMIDLNNNLVLDAYDWLQSKIEPETDPEILCTSRDIFIARLDKLRTNLEKKANDQNFISLLIAVTGEIGNNSFDHNLGSWRDLAGVYFIYDLKEKMIVLADRGQGIKATIQKVKPKVKDDLEALKVAFTETISGRAPEQRGNGLKFVTKVIQDKKLDLFFHSGNASIEITKPNYQLELIKNKINIKGTLAVIYY